MKYVSFNVRVNQSKTTVVKELKIPLPVILSPLFAFNLEHYSVIPELYTSCYCWTWWTAPIFPLSPLSLFP